MQRQLQEKLTLLNFNNIKSSPKKLDLTCTNVELFTTNFYIKHIQIPFLGIIPFQLAEIDTQSVPIGQAMISFV